MNGTIPTQPTNPDRSGFSAFTSADLGDNGQSEEELYGFNHIRSLGVQGWETETLPSVGEKTVITRKDIRGDLLAPENTRTIGERNMVLLGEGLEGIAYLYFVRDRATQELLPRVIKVFKDPIQERGRAVSKETETADWATAALIAASNARFADFVANPKGIVKRINGRDDQIKFELDISAPEYPDFQKSLGTVEAINTPERVASFIQWAGWYISQQTTPNGREMKHKYPYFQAYIDPRSGQRVVSPYETYIMPRLGQLQQRMLAEFQNPAQPYRGGLAKYFNRVLELTNEAFSDPAFTTPPREGAPNPYYIHLPKKIFAEVPFFGQFPDNYNNRRFAGKMYTIMEYTPSILENELENAQKELKEIFMAKSERLQQVGRQLSPVMIQREVLQKIPVNRLYDMHYLATMLHSFGLAICDPSFGNVAVDRQGNTVLIDPSPVALIGATQDIATPIFGYDKDGAPIYLLPEQEVRALEAGVPITVSAQRDLYVIGRLIQIAQKEFGEKAADMEDLRDMHRRVEQDKRAAMSMRLQRDAEKKPTWRERLGLK